MQNLITLRNNQIRQLGENLNNRSSHIDYLKHKHLVTFVGLCGTGKSTIINNILQNQLTIEKKNGLKLIVPFKNNLQPHNQNNKYPQIGNSLTMACTKSPQLYEVEGYNNLVLCDTPGFDIDNHIFNGADLLHEIYLKEAKAVVAIIFVVSKDELQSRRGGGMSAIFDSFNRYSSIQHVKNHLLLVVNYKYESEETDDQLKLDLYNQFVKFQTQLVTKYESKQYIAELQKPKLQFFTTMLGKKSYQDQSNIQSFSRKVIICRRSYLLNTESNFRQILLNDINQRILNNNKLTIKSSNQLISFGSYVIKDFSLKKNHIQNCISKSFVFLKSKMIQDALWKLSDSNQNFNLKQQFLNNVLLNTIRDIQESQKIVNNIQHQLKHLQKIKSQKVLVATFNPPIEMIEFLPELSVMIKAPYEVIHINKDYSGFEIQIETLKKQQGLYQAFYKPTQGRKRIQISLYTSNEIYNRQLRQMLIESSNFMQKKMESFFILEDPNLKNQLFALSQKIKTTKNYYKEIQKFIKNYSMSEEQMIACIPHRQDFQIYQCQAIILPFVHSGKSQIQQLLKSLPNQDFKNIKFLNFQGKVGYCSLNYHVIENPVYFQCGHYYQKSCISKYLINHKQCVVCGKQLVEQKISEQLQLKIREEYHRIFRLPLWRETG